MAYAIMRAAKLSTMGSVAASLGHCFRERETPNADASRTHQNAHGEAKTKDEAMGRMRALLPVKRRKDAVLAIEYVMTASPDWWKQASPDAQSEFFLRSREWIENKYGADRVIVATIHRDEASPHLSAFVVPLTADGRLSAKEFIGGRDKMSTDQTTFAETVRDLGLERGIEGSKAIHERVKTFYGSLENPVVLSAAVSPETVKPKVLAKGVFTTTVESPEMIAERLAKQLAKALTGTFARASTAVSTQRQLAGVQRTAASQAERLAMFRGLTVDQVRQVADFAAKLYHENVQQLKQKFQAKTQDDQSDELRHGRGRGR